MAANYTFCSLIYRDCVTYSSIRETEPVGDIYIYIYVCMYVCVYIYVYMHYTHTQVYSPTGLYKYIQRFSASNWLIRLWGLASQFWNLTGKLSRWNLGFRETRVSLVRPFNWLMRPTQIIKDNLLCLKSADVNCIYKVFSQQHLDNNLNNWNIALLIQQN